jgi:hypothetical protein
MGSGEFCGKLFLSRFRPLAVDELKEIEADSDRINSDQLGDMLDVIDVTIHRAFFFSWTDQHGINADYTAPLADQLDLFVTDVALDIVIATNICVRHDGRSCCNRQNFVEPGWIDVRKINDHAETLGFANHVAPKAG